MPSKAFSVFEKHLLKDVRRLIELHKEIHGGPGKPDAVLPRSGIFLLSAAWEIYVEEVATELSDWMMYQFDDPMGLPDTMQKVLASAVRARGEMEALKLAGLGWKNVYREVVVEHVESLNTPNASKIVVLMRNCAGIDLAAFLGPESVRLTAFAKKRGNIAHQGAKAGHVSIKDLSADYAYICDLVERLDNYLIEQAKPLLGYQPWKRRRK